MFYNLPVRFGFLHPIGIFPFRGFPLRFTKPIQGLLFQGVQESGDLVLPDSYSIAMVNEKGSNVNTISKDQEEIMIPYNCIVQIAWDKDVGTRLQDVRNAKNISQKKLATLTEPTVSFDTILKWEQGKVASVSRERLDFVLKTLGADIRDLFPTVTIKSFSQKR